MCGFDDRWIMIVGIPIGGFIVSVMLFHNYYDAGNWQFLSVCIPMSLVYTASFWFCMRMAYTRVKGFFPDLKDIGKRIAIMFVVLLLVYVVINFLLDNLFGMLFAGHKTEPSVVMEIISTMLLTALVIAIYEAISFYTQLQQTVAEKVELERRHVQSQLESLRNQVNPHFLFNSLNTLIYLIPENPDNAVRFVQKLSKVYRYVLESRDASVIPLKEELDYLNAYVYLLRERFGENLIVDTQQLDALENALIVPLTLQMLFENVIKHNIISAEKPLKIETFYENEHIVVRNNLQRKNQTMDSTGVGLDNIRERYQFLTQKEVGVIVSKEYFTVLIPVIFQKAA